MNKKIKVLYFASVKEKTQKDQELVQTEASTVQDLYNELNLKYLFNFEDNYLKVAINEEYSDFDTYLKDNDTVVFIPPVAGG